MIGPLASILHLLYTLFLLAVGAWGIFFLDWEVASFYALGPDAFDGVAGATLHNQFRFLKAIELTFGIFSFVYRKDILAGGLNCTIFLAGVFLGIFARGLSWLLDGTPHPAFQTFFVAEILIFLFVWLNARQAMAKP
jgi:hypothetical protein